MVEPFTRTMDTTYYPTPSFGTPYRAATHAMVPPAKNVEPVKDSRYPAYSGTMSDGRLVTDYRPKCSKNIAPQNQFHSKLWMIHHAADMMDESRRRQVEWTGASLPMANTMPPPAVVVHSTPFASDATPTGWKEGLGVERANAVAPPLFGTFEFEPSMAELQSNRKSIGMTLRYEGGRNSVRGKFAQSSQ